VHLHLVLANFSAVVGALAHEGGLGESLLDASKLNNTSRSMLRGLRVCSVTASGASAALAVK